MENDGSSSDNSSAEDAYDAFLEAALRGEDPAANVDDLVPDGTGDSEAVKDVLLGLGRILRGESDPENSSARRLSADTDVPFERLGDYRLIRRLGQGGMGVVYLAEQESVTRLVALKLLRPELVGSKDAEVRFRREVQAAAQLNHPNIVTVFGSGTDQGVTYLAMELVPGNGLDEILAQAKDRGEQIPLKDAVSWGAQIASALSVAHEDGFIHRDVKPSNIRIGRGGRAMLLDFGLARKIDSATFTMTGAFTGSPYYASPEQFRARRYEVNHTSDIYSLGVTLYECVTGRVPFEGDTPERLLHQVLTAEPPPLRSLRPDASRDLEAVILHAMEKTPSRRYAATEVLSKDLNAVLQLQPISVRPPGALTRTRKWVRRHRGPALAVGLSLAVVVTFLLTMVVKNLEETHRFEGLLRIAQTKLAEKDYGGALEIVDQSLGLRGDDPEARLLRIEIEQGRDESEAAFALRDAEERLVEFAAVSNRLLELDALIAPLEQQEVTRWLAREEREELVKARREKAEAEEDFEELLFRVESGVHRATLLSPQSPGVKALRASYALERWRRAEQSGDARSAERFRRAIVESDVAGLHADALRSTGFAEFTSEPAGAEVYLFRYQSHSEVVVGGDQRMVPVPVSGDVPVPPGTVVLRVDEDSGEARRGDLILKVRGRSVGATNFVSKDDVILDEFLVSVDGVSALDSVFARVEPFERIIAAGFRRADQLDPADYVFNVGGVLETRRARTFVDLDRKVWSPREAIGMEALEAEVYRDGEILSVTLPKGLRTWSTAAPTFLLNEASVGVTPVPALELDVGSYLAVLRWPDDVLVRVPFVVRPGKTEALQVAAPKVTPPIGGMVYIPAGRVTVGGDWLAPFAEAAHEVEVEGFWISTSEVTLAEYEIFLNDPEIRALAMQSAYAYLVPDHRITSNENDRWQFDPESERYRLPKGRSREPVIGLDQLAAQAYASWLTKTLVARSDEYAFRVPTEFQWEKAARGGDGRAFSFGDHFEPRWVKSRYSSVLPTPDRVNSYPIDESVYGVVDMVGSVMEWCRSSFSAERSNLTVVRGGSWALSVPSDFRASKRIGQLPSRGSNHIGMRVVFERVQPDEGADPDDG